MKSLALGFNNTVNIMKLFIPPLIATAMLIALPAHGNAESCVHIANEVAAQNGGELLSVNTVGSGDAAECRITILIKSSDGGPARKKTITVRK